APRLVERGEAGHRGALDAQRDGVVQPEQAVLAHAGGIGEVGGRRIQAPAGGPVAVAGRAVADRTVGREVGGGGPQVGDLTRGHAHVVEIDDAPAQIGGDRAHLVGRSLVANGPEQPRRGGLQRGALRPGRQSRDHPADRRGELDLLVVLALVQDAAVLDRAAVVDGQVVEGVQERPEGVRLVGRERGRGRGDRREQEREEDRAPALPGRPRPGQRPASRGVTAMASLPMPATRAASMTSTTRPCATSVSASITTAISGSLRARDPSRAARPAGSTRSRSRYTAPSRLIEMVAGALAASARAAFGRFTGMPPWTLMERLAIMKNTSRKNTVSIMGMISIRALRSGRRRSFTGCAARGGPRRAGSPPAPWRPWPARPGPRSSCRGRACRWR